MRFLLYTITLVLLLTFHCSITQQPDSAKIDFSEIYLFLPHEAYPVEQNIRLQLSDSMSKSNYQFKFNQCFYRFNNNAFLAQLLPLPDSTDVTASTVFFIQKNAPDHPYNNTFLEFRVYLTHSDTFLLSRYYSIIDTTIVYTLKAYQLHNSLEFKAIPLPNLTLYDCAKTPQDSAIMHMQHKEGTLSLVTYLDEKGFAYAIQDQTINIGPIEPPQTRPLKYFSDFKTIDPLPRVTITSKGLIKE